MMWRLLRGASCRHSVALGASGYPLDGRIILFFGTRFAFSPQARSTFALVAKRHVPLVNSTVNNEPAI